MLFKRAVSVVAAVLGAACLSGFAGLLVQSPLGFRVKVPDGWTVSQSEDRLMIAKPLHAQNAGIYIHTCPEPTADACLGDGGFPRRLVQTLKGVRLGNLPATEYTFERETVAHTRAWTEILTVAAANGRGYAVGVQVPFQFESTPWEHYLSAYMAVRDSFRLQ